NDHDGLYAMGVDTPIGNVSISITDANGAVHLVETDAGGFYNLEVTNGVTTIQVDTTDPDFPANLILTTDAHNQGSNPTTIFVPAGGAAEDNTGYTYLNLMPSLGNDTAYTKQGVPVSGNVLLNDDPGETPSSSLAVVAGPSQGAAVLHLDGSYTYTPNPSFFGLDSFTYQLCDLNGDCATATVTITVNPVPKANDDNPTVNEDTLLSGTVAANDIPSADGGNVWSL